MQKIKFDFEATKERIYAPNSNVPIGAPVDQNGNIANDGNAYGIVLCKETENEKYWVKYNLVVMVAGYCDIIDAQAIWGDEYSAEAMAAMSGITFCDNHMIPGGSDPAIANAKATGGIGWTEQGEQTVITWDGDTDGRDSFSADGFTYYKVAEKGTGYTDNAVVADNEGTTYESQFFSGENASAYVGEGTFAIVADGGEFAIQVGEDVITSIAPSAGVYFANIGEGYIATLTYGTPDTVHKIDEKYISGGGGGVDGIVIVHATVNTETMKVVLDKTFDELHNENLNSAVMIVGIGKQPLFFEGETDEAMFFGSTVITDAGGTVAFAKIVITLSPDNSVEINFNEFYAQMPEE